MGQGTNLGQATGRINIDTSGLSSVTTATRQAGIEAEKNLSRIGTGAAKAQVGLGNLASAARGLVGAFGISLGAAGVAQMARFAIEVDAVATAYERQSVAALSLAGSQNRLNALLEAYDKATGGAIDKATALADVTRLQAVGFADSAEELTQFATAARGISVAMGAQQDYVISQLQLAIANQSTMRLDQLGLGVSEVTQRIDALKAANKSMTAEMAYQQAILGLATEKYGALATSAAASATGAEKASKAWADVRLEIGKLAGPGINLAGLLIASRLEGEIAKLRAWGDAWAYVRKQIGVPINAPFVQARGIDDTQTRMATAPRFTDEQESLIRDRYDTMRDIETSTGKAIVDATRQYGEQRTSAVRQYEQTIARESEDFARSRARAEAAHLEALADLRKDAAARETKQAADLARAIQQANADSAERIAEWEEDYGKAVADARANSNTRLTKIEEDYQKNRARAAEDSRDRLMDAAGRLDAVAVRQEQDRFAKDSARAEEAYKERVDDEQENLQKAIDQLNEAHAERIADERKALDKSNRQRQDAYDRQLTEQRAADAEREQDLIDDFAARKVLEDEDRAIRLQRMAADHVQRLGEMARQHSLDLAQIAADAADRRKQAEEDFNKAANEAGIRNAKWIAQNNRLTEAAIKDYDKAAAAIVRWAAAARMAAEGEPTFLSQQGPMSRAPAPVAPYSPVGGWENSRTITIQPGAITIYGAVGQDEEKIGDIAEERLIKVLEGAAQ